MFFPVRAINHLWMLYAGIMFFSFSSAVHAGGPGSMSPQRVASMLEEAAASFQQQKVFLHTDKTEYLAGETIWLKAYVVSATTHVPDTLSTNLHVELLNQDGDMAYMLLLRLDEGTAHGDMPIHDSIPGGNYRFRAYTDWMLNFDEDLIFTDDIYIHNPIEERFIRRLDVLRNRRFNRALDKQREEMQFAFFAEGGNLVAGLENKVAFKAANALGAGVEAQGRVVDAQGTQVAALATYYDGMGSFAFTPEHGKTYTAHIRFANGQGKRLKLPKAEATASLLSVRQGNEEIHIRVESNYDVGGGEPNGRHYLLVHARGNPLHVEQFTLEGRLHELSLPAEDFPDGVGAVMLLDADGLPLAERMVFINNGRTGRAELIAKNTAVRAGKKTLDVKLQVDEHQGGSYSVAMLDARRRSKKLRNNIAAELLLFSDIATTHKHPGFFLDRDSEMAAKAVDLLMLTHFWRRFDWNDIVREEFPEIRHGFPKGIAIAGTVTPRSSSRETGAKQVELIVEQDRIEMFNTTTDRKGNFSFTNLAYDGFFTARIRLEAGHDKRAFHLELLSQALSDLEYKPSVHTRALETTSRSDDWERVLRPGTTLASRRNFIASPSSPGMYSDVDQVIYFDDIRNQYSRVIDVLETRVRGLVVDGGQILLRGPSSLIHHNEPLFLIDDQVVTRGRFLQTNVQEIDRLTVISGPQSAVFGSRGSNGALLLYTVRGDRHMYESFEYLLKGFHIPAESFQSKIHTASYDNYGIDRSISWKPNAKADENNIIAFSVSMDEDVKNARLIFQGIDETGRVFYTDFYIDIEGTD